jgi:SAM-dependent methyltransferase
MSKRLASVPAQRWAEAQRWEKQYWRGAPSSPAWIAEVSANMARYALWLDTALSGRSPGDTWVEMGIGPLGIGANHFLPVVAEHSLIGIDPLPLFSSDELDIPPPLYGLLAACRQSYRHIQAPAEHTGLPDRSAGLVTLVNMLDHVQDPLGVLAEARRLLQPGGELYLVCDAFSTLSRAKRAAWGRHRRPDTVEYKAHPFRFSHADLEMLCVDSDLQLVVSTRHDLPGWTEHLGHSRRLHILARRPE